MLVTFLGNNRDDACRYSPGNSPHVINVGATQKNDKLYRYSTGGSNFGDCVSLYAPGQLVVAADENYGVRYVCLMAKRIITCSNMCMCVLIVLFFGLMFIVHILMFIVYMRSML